MENTNQNKENELINLADEGTVTITGQPSEYTEKGIAQDREAIINQLHGAYIGVAKTMKPYQDEWDDNWPWAITTAIASGSFQGAVDWGQSNAELFEKETWSEMADSISNGIGSIFDAASNYAVQQHKAIVRNVNEALDEAGELIDNPSETLLSWHTTVYDIAEDRIDDIKNTVYLVSEEIKEDLAFAEKLYEYKDEIFELPELIAKGGDESVKKIQQFISGPLRAIDPKLADEIKNNPNLPAVLEIIADHKTAMAYFTYAGLLYNAVPNNFYFYLASRGGAFLGVEVLLTLLLALFTAGTAAVARLGLLAVRISTMAKTIQNLPKLQQAITSFTQALTVYENAASDLLALGGKINHVRSASVVGKIASKSELKIKRKTEKRNHNCKLCGKEDHATPTKKHGIAIKSKSSEYRPPLERKVSKSHPIYKGIAMQAHHLIAGEVSKQYKDEIELYDYDINWTTNLSFIPSTWQGACHLGVQPHIGNHGMRTVINPKDGSDYQLDKTYVASVEKYVKRILNTVKKKSCPYKSSHQAELRKKFDKLSKQIADLLSLDPPELHLSKASMLFGEGQVGCGGQQEVAFKRGAPSRQAPAVFAEAAKKALSNKDNKFSCKHGRDHFGHGAIQYAKPSPSYKLKPGN